MLKHPASPGQPHDEVDDDDDGDYSCDDNNVNGDDHNHPHHHQVGVSPAWYSSPAESSLCSRSVHLFPLPWMEEAVRGSLR